MNASRPHWLVDIIGSENEGNKPLSEQMLRRCMVTYGIIRGPFHKHGSSKSVKISFYSNPNYNSMILTEFCPGPVQRKFKQFALEEWNYSRMKFTLNLNLKKIVNEMGLWPQWVDGGDLPFRAIIDRFQQRHLSLLLWQPINPFKNNEKKCNKCLF